MAMKHLHNSILFLVLTFVAGCGGSSLVTRWDGARGHGEVNPFETSLGSRDEFETCRTERREQRLALLCDAGVLTGDRCHPESSATSSTVTVGYREAVLLICQQSDAMESNGESRTISRDDCTRLLHDIAADTTGTVTASAPPPPPPSVTDPYVLRILTMNPALWQDDHAFCMNATSSYGVPGSGYVGYGYGSGSGYYGGMPVIGTVGGGSGVYGTIVTAPPPVTGR